MDNLKVGECVYTLDTGIDISNCKIVNGLITAKEYAKPNTYLYFQEALLFKYLHCLDNNLYISDKSIKKSCELFHSCQDIRLTALIKLGNADTNNTLITINDITHFTIFSNLMEGPLIHYLDFLKRVALIDIDINEFITKYFK